ncbi:MAG: glycosyltransferase family 4 protein [Blastocatellia bacterium]
MAKEIVFVVGKDPLIEMGGHSSYVRAHARAAIRLGFEPHLFCAGFDEGVVETDFGVLHRLLSPLGRFRHQAGGGIRVSTLPLHEPMLAASVERFLGARGGPSLIHGFGVWASAGVKAARGLQRRGIQAVPIASAYTALEHEHQGKLRGVNRNHRYSQRLFALTEHQWIKRVITRYERRAYRESRLVLVNYESVRLLLLAHFGERLNLRRAPYCSELAFLREDRSAAPAIPPDLASLEPKDAPLVVSVSRHDPRKGVDTLIHSLARLRAAGVRFRACLVGGGGLLESHRRLGASLGLGAETLITGFVADAFAYLRLADVFALPSLEEGSGSVSLLEAMQARVAVVASNVDGIPEDVTDGYSALLVEPGNVSALSRAIERVLADTDLRHRLGRRARETFDEKFSPDTLTGALQAIYAELGFTP